MSLGMFDSVNNRSVILQGSSQFDSPGVEWLNLHNDAGLSDNVIIPIAGVIIGVR